MTLCSLKICEYWWSVGRKGTLWGTEQEAKLGMQENWDTKGGGDVRRAGTLGRGKSEEKAKVWGKKFILAKRSFIELICMIFYDFQ